MKKISKIMVLAAIPLLCLLGCAKESDSDLLTSLPASGAEHFVTNNEEMIKLNSELASYFVSGSYMSDPAIAIIGKAFSSIDVNSIKPDFAAIFKEEGKKLDNFKFILVGGSLDGLNYSLNRKIGTVKGLPKGIEADSPSMIFNIKIKETDEQNVYVADFDSDIDVYASCNLVDIDNSAAKSLLKGVNGRMKINGTASVKFRYDRTSTPEFISANLNFTAGLDFGGSYCMDSGLGGKQIISIKFIGDGTLDDSESIRELIELLNEDPYMAVYNEKLWDNLPMRIETKDAYYDDKNKELFSEESTISMHDLALTELGVLNMARSALGK